MVTNCVGSPVTGKDFFAREGEQAFCWECLTTDHLLLLAPRRVGKTSLMLKLQDTARDHGYDAALFSGAEAQDEAGFIARLYETVGKLGAWSSIRQRLAEGPVGRFLQTLHSVELGPFSVEFSREAEAKWELLGERLIRALDQQQEKSLILVDEVPIFILSLLRLDPSGERARRFLNWFRSIRQRSGSNGSLRWLLAGSIGLDTVAARLNLGDTINDLHIFHLGAFSREVAGDLLGELSRSHKLPLSSEASERILERVGWTIPFYLQLVFSELRGQQPSARTQVTPERVDQAFDSLLRPAKKAYFDFWRQRLVEELGKPDADFALTLLNTVAADPTGASRGTLSQCLAKPIRNTEQRREKLRYLLDVLVYDGYVVEVDGSDRFHFRSPLLREFWARRVLP
jgi:uncharacterized protein